MTATFNLETGSHMKGGDSLEDYIQCDWCGDDMGEAYAEAYNGDDICEDCHDNASETCDECGEIHHDDEMFNVRHHTVCRGCKDDYTTECDSCGNLEWDDHIHTDDNSSLCDSCYDDYYRCNNCENFVHRYNVMWNRYDDAYCTHCYEEESDLINSYGYKPDVQFYGYAIQGDYYGVELEVDTPEDDYVDLHEAAESVLSWTDGELYNKEDGSLDNGFELVTHPCSFDYHMDEMQWTEILKDLQRSGLRSHDVGTCGIHVHISRKGFGDTIDEQDLNVAKLLLVVEKFWDEMVTFSRRTHNQMRRWAASYAEVNGMSRGSLCERELLETAKNSARYFAVNLENTPTIELRLFRGTLNPNTFKATLQFVKALHSLIIDYSIDEIHSMSWNGIARYLERQGYVELNNYLEQRGLAYKSIDQTVMQKEEEEETSNTQTGMVYVFPEELPTGISPEGMRLFSERYARFIGTGN